MVGRCLAARPTLQQPILWENVTSKLFKILASTSYQFIAEQIAEVLVALGDQEVNQRLLLLFSNKQIDSVVRQSITNALGKLGERAVASDLVKLLSNKQIDSSVRIISDVHINSSVRQSIARALGTLGERAVASDLVKLPPDVDIDRLVRQSIANALGTLIDDEAMIYLLAALLPDSDIADSICRTLWTVSRRCHVRISINDKAGEKQLEVVKW